MNSSKVIVAGLLFVTIGSGCDYSLKRQASETPAGPQSFALSVTDLVVETSGTATVANGEFQLLENGTGNLGCELTGTEGATTGLGSVNNSLALSSFSNYMAVSFRYPFTVKPSSVVLRLKKNSSPTASAIVELTTATGRVPVLSNVVASSNAVAMSGASSGLSGGNQTFSFAAAPTLSAQADYSIVLRGVSGSGTIDGTNNLNWRVGNDINDCTDIDDLQNSSNTGSTWSDQGAAPYFNFVVPKYASSGSGYWIIDGGKEIAWDLSSFSVSENPNGDKSGSVTYSIGAGLDATTPTYSATALTQAQVKALSSVTGRYLYVRVILSSGYSDFSGAGSASGTVSGL